MKFSDPTFPTQQLIKKIVSLVKEHSDDTVDLVIIANVTACYAARWIMIRRGTVLTKEDWLKQCLIAYSHTDDERAKDAISTN